MNFDIDVPLFLGALYGDRRVHDIQLLRQVENRNGDGKRFAGQACLALDACGRVAMQRSLEIFTAAGS